MPSTIDAIEEGKNLELPPGHSAILSMDETGDTKHIWNRANEAEVESARAVFNTLKKKGYTAYRVKGGEGEKGEVMNEFDPQAERMIMAPRMVGG